jgi:hypothetical protein
VVEVARRRLEAHRMGRCSYIHDRVEDSRALGLEHIVVSLIERMLPSDVARTPD